MYGMTETPSTVTWKSLLRWIVTRTRRARYNGHKN